MKIDLTELLRKMGNEAEVETEEKVDFSEDGLNLAGPVKVKLNLTNTGTSVMVNGSVAAEAELACSRCLGKFKFPLQVKIFEEYAKALPAVAAKKGKEIELKEKDFVFSIEKDNSIDLGETIRQNLLLALPLRPLCRSECKGE